MRRSMFPLPALLLLAPLIALPETPGDEQIRELAAARDALRARAEEAHAMSVELAQQLGDARGTEEALLRQRIALARVVADQAECHARGKGLAIAELEAAAGVRGAAARAGELRPVIEACIASGEASGEVRFPSADDGRVHGRLYGFGLHGVVLAHGGRFTKESWATQARALEQAGLRVLAIDFRGRGRSRGPDNARPDSEFNDVLGALDYLRETGSTRLSLVGASFGGAAVAQAASRYDPAYVDAVVLLAPSVIADPSTMAGRKLFVVAEDDMRGGGVQRLDEIRTMVEATPGPSELAVFGGKAHAQFLFESDQGEAVLERIEAFLLAR